MTADALAFDIASGAVYGYNGTTIGMTGPTLLRLLTTGGFLVTYGEQDNARGGYDGIIRSILR